MGHALAGLSRGKSLKEQLEAGSFGEVRPLGLAWLS